MLTHQNERPEKCPIQTCEFYTKGFARKYDKNRHILTHYKGIIMCDFCPGAQNSFNRVDIFKLHLISVHGVEQTPPNAHKKSLLATGSSKKGNTGKRPGRCSECAVTFGNAQYLYEHVDDCFLRQIHQADPSETIYQWTIASDANDQSAQETMEKHMLSLNQPWGPGAFYEDWNLDDTPQGMLQGREGSRSMSDLPEKVKATQQHRRHIETDRRPIASAFLPSQLYNNSDTGSRPLIVQGSPAQPKQDVVEGPSQAEVLPYFTHAREILLVDSNVVNQKRTSDILVEHGHQVTLVSHPLVALQKMWKKKFDVVLMEQQIHGITGFSVVSEIVEEIRNYEQRNQLARTVIVALVTDATIFNVSQRLLEEQIDGFLLQPFDANSLIQTIECCITSNTLQNPQAGSGYIHSNSKPKAYQATISVDPAEHKPTNMRQFTFSNATVDDHKGKSSLLTQTPETSRNLSYNHVRFPRRTDKQDGEVSDRGRPSSNSPGPEYQALSRGPEHLKAGAPGSESILDTLQTDVVQSDYKHAYSRPYHCLHKGCEKSFVEKRSLARHLTASHPSVQTFFCPVAECRFAHKGFARRDSLSRHMGRSHHPNAEQLIAPDPSLTRDVIQESSRTEHGRAQDFRYASSDMEGSEPESGEPGHSYRLFATTSSRLDPAITSSILSKHMIPVSNHRNETLPLLRSHSPVEEDSTVWPQNVKLPPIRQLVPPQLEPVKDLAEAAIQHDSRYAYPTLSRREIPAATDAGMSQHSLLPTGHSTGIGAYTEVNTLNQLSH